MPQKAVRALTVIISSFLTMVILVGATHLYNRVVYAKPLENTMTKMSSISSFKVEKLKSRYRIEVQFSVREKLRASFYLLLDQLAEQNYREPENLTIVIQNPSNAELRDFMTQARLPLFEAISTGKFTELPAHLDRKASRMGVVYELEVDNNYVFITASSGDKTAHMILNRGGSPLMIINTMGGEYL
ncbi:MAG: hypothetical protein QHH10_02200 [Peptococcaceae bacterium]|nr:hypothetical protein [Peptococcaceae bacterium]MDH7524110.1 hypothetical protein [Peptococcaceae bacterium]